MSSSLFLFWEPASLGILYWLKILAAFWEAEMGHHDWFSHHNICCCWAGGLHKPKPHSCPPSCWQFSLESCSGRWSGPQKREEGRGRERGREKGCPWEPLVLVSTSWLSSNHLSQTSCMSWSGQSDPILLLCVSHYIMYFFMCLLVSFLTEMHSPNIFMLTNLTALLWIFSSLALLMFFSRLSDQSCTQCSREKSNSDLYEGTAVPLVIFRVSDICIQRTVPPILESLRSSQGLMMQFAHCLLESAVAHSWRTALSEHSLFPSFFSLLLGSRVPIPASSQPHEYAALALPHNWLLLTRWYNSDQSCMIQGQTPCSADGSLC